MIILETDGRNEAIKVVIDIVDRRLLSARVMREGQECVCENQRGEKTTSRDRRPSAQRTHCRPRVETPMLHGRRLENHGYAPD